MCDAQNETRERPPANTMANRSGEAIEQTNCAFRKIAKLNTSPATDTLHEGHCANAHISTSYEFQTGTHNNPGQSGRQELN